MPNLAKTRSRSFPTVNFFQSSKRCRAILSACVAIGTLFVCESNSQGQDRFKDFSATSVFREVNAGTSYGVGVDTFADAWWERHVKNSMREVQPMPADLHTILYLAIHHSNQIQIAKMDPLIRETAVQEADSAFDWVRYLDAAWNDTSEPVSNALTVGGNGTRFNDQTYQATGGVRRTTRSGGQLDISQRFGWQDNNSQFFIPNDQATGRLTLSYTHPLLRGRGAAYNNAIVFLAQLDSEVAQDEFLSILQDELLEITRAYWNLHLERATLAHQLRLYLRTQEIHRTLAARQVVDAQGTQLVLAASALENRRAELIRAQTAVTNSETRLRGMLNAQELGNSDQVELIPVEPLPDFHMQTDLQNELQVALQNRPEVRAAVQQVKAGSVRLGVAQNELLPALNLVTQGYLSGLQGDSDFTRAFGDQFSVGRPSYSVGFQYELPVGNRLAKSRVCRRQHELTRLQTEYARALEAVTTEVDIAVRELHTSYREIVAKRRALAAAEAEVSTIDKRWQRMIDGNGTSSLNLESLLRAQERVTEAEREYVTSQLTYSLAMVNLKRSNGTLLQSEAVSVTPVCNAQGCRDIVLDKGMAGNSVGNVGGCQGCTTGCQTCATQGSVAPVNYLSGAKPADNQNQWNSTVVGSNADKNVRFANHPAGSNNPSAGAAVVSPYASLSNPVVTASNQVPAQQYTPGSTKSPWRQAQLGPVSTADANIPAPTAPAWTSPVPKAPATMPMAPATVAPAPVAAPAPTVPQYVPSQVEVPVFSELPKQ